MGDATDNADDVTELWLVHMAGKCDADCPFCPELYPDYADHEAGRLILDSPDEPPY